MVIDTSALEGGHGSLVIFQRTTIGPAPEVWVKVALGVLGFGLKVPDPALTTDQLPVPDVGVFPPSPDVVPPEQMVCGPPVVAVVGG